MTDSQKLLAEYARTGSDAAFRELVTRYVDLVYSTALRLVNGDSHRAEDVAQTVFVDLSRLARTLSNDVMPGGWLHRHTCFVATNTMRGERRRLSRERQAVEMNALQDNSGADFSLVAPILDEAINELGEADRTAILLRFFEQRDFRSVGQALGSNEDAARMRVNRALEKLESLLKRRNIIASSTALAVVLGANAVHAAPASLAATIATAAALAGTTFATTATATKVITMTALQKTLVAATLIVAAGSGIYEAHQASNLGTQVQTLQQQQTTLIGQIQQLQRQRYDATNRLASLTDELENAKSNSPELLKLRSELTRVKNANALLATAGKDPSQLEAEALVERTNKLKQKLAETTNAQIPELQFLTEEDWADAARGNLDSEADLSKAFSLLRGDGEHHFLESMQTALQKYIKANNDQFPTDLSQLKPYFEITPGVDILRRYHIVPANSMSSVLNGGDWLITQKSFIDEENDTQYDLGRNGLGGASYRDVEALNTLAPAMKAFNAAAPANNDGRNAIGLQQLLPYLTTPEQKAAYDKLMHHRSLDSR